MPFPESGVFLRLRLSTCSGERGLWGAAGEGDPSSSGRHSACTAQGTCQALHSAELRAEQAGLILTTAHSSPFLSSSKKNAYVLHRDDDFAVV